MIEENLVEFIEILMLATAVAVVVKFIRLPYTIALVFAGLMVALPVFCRKSLLAERLSFLFFCHPCFLRLR